MFFIFRAGPGDAAKDSHFLYVFMKSKLENVFFCFSGWARATAKKTYFLQDFIKVKLKNVFVLDWA